MPDHSVVHADVNVLLAWVRDDLLFLLALEGRQLLDSLLDDLQSALNLFVGNDQRRRQANDVLVGGLGLRKGISFRLE